jgi:hypothetical protein
MGFIGKRDLAIICIGKRNLYHILSGLRAEICLNISGAENRAHIINCMTILMILRFYHDFTDTDNCMANIFYDN